jgi:hypothetical protein
MVAARPALLSGLALFVIGGRAEVIPWQNSWTENSPSGVSTSPNSVPTVPGSTAEGDWTGAWPGARNRAIIWPNITSPPRLDAAGALMDELVRTIVFGGRGYPAFSASDSGLMNDMWVYTHNTDEWRRFGCPKCTNDSPVNDRTCIEIASDGDCDSYEDEFCACSCGRGRIEPTGDNSFRSYRSSFFRPQVLNCTHAYLHTYINIHVFIQMSVLKSAPWRTGLRHP